MNAVVLIQGFVWDAVLLQFGEELNFRSKAGAADFQVAGFNVFAGRGKPTRGQA